ncbi:G-patch domain and KOW motifs-containing protein-like [Physella acuta]|uniref:G-patch domain and KOW motifs-containing protein-like n=1 Tax=Physella acuta TaxID=109671 RepID=UPI0027DDBB5F|nr:G-patch domain and KOW motifs-containing protein-like [Physella acuta]
MESNHKEATKPTVSFGFSKKQETKQLLKSVVSETTDRGDLEPDYVLSLENKEVHSTQSTRVTKNQELVIPLIKQNNWRVEGSRLKGPSSKTLETKIDSLVSESLDAQAAKEILQESAKYNETWEDRGTENTNISIPLLMQNKIPQGFETDEKLNVELRPDEPDDADYDKIPIEQYGLAMLRGMGWNQSRGIGKNGKVVAPVQALLRPKGLGLGADKSNTGSDKKATQESVVNAEEDRELKKNSHCMILSGVNKDLYGIVEGLDEDNARVLIKLTVSGKTVNIMQNNVSVVSKKEYDKFSKYLNKDKVDKYNKEQEKISSNKSSSEAVQTSDKKRAHKSRKRDASPNDNNSYHKKQRKDKNKHNSDSVERKKHKSKYKKYERQPSSSSGSDSSDEIATKIVPQWLKNDLKVRIIDKDLKRGKLYNTKVVIIDVPSSGICICKTEDGKVIENVSQSQLETVVPKSDNSYIAVVSGSYRGQIGQIMKRNKDLCLAVVQLLSDRDIVLKLHYDEICEYVGDIQNHDDY